MIKYISLVILLTSLLNGWSLKVTVNGIQVDKDSQIGFGLYRPDDNFPILGKEYKGKYLNVTSSSMTYQFDNIETGTYAVSVYHDTNANHQLDHNFFDVPTEGYGFSNNVRGTFSSPSFEDASIVIDKNLQTVITLIY